MDEEAETKSVESFYGLTVEYDAKKKADVCVPKLRSNSAQPLYSIKTCH